MEEPARPQVARTRRVPDPESTIPPAALIAPAAWTPAGSTSAVVKINGITFRSERPHSRAQEAEINNAVETIMASR